MLKYNQACAHQRFDGTVIRYKGIPVKIVHIDAYKYKLFSLVTGTYIERDVELINLDLDISPVPLGYINSTNNKTTYYASRRPVRKMKQGLDYTNLIVRKDSNTVLSKPVTVEFLNSKDLGRTILRQYPTLQECINAFKKDDEIMSMAFHPYYAIDRNYNLYHKTNKIGVLSPKKLDLDTKYKFLLEELMEVLS